MDGRENGMFYAWRRYWARGLDLFFYGLLWYLIAGPVFHINLMQEGIAITLFNLIMQLILTILIEPLLLNRFGTTPGKAVFGIRVVQENGERLTVSQGFSRTLGVIVKGMGLSIPIYGIYKQYKSYDRCADCRIQPWDEGISYTIKDTRWYRWLVFAAAHVLIFCGLIAVILVGQIPPDRGNLTVSDFAENFNYLADYYGFHMGGKYLDVNGRWQDEVTADGNYTVELLAIDVPEFVYEVEDGYVTGISFLVEERGLEEAVSTLDTQMTLAVLAYAGAQKGVGLFSNDRLVMADCIGGHYFADYHIVYRGIDIVCDREAEGYIGPISGILIPDEDSLYYKIEFVMKKDESAIGVTKPVCTNGK